MAPTAVSTVSAGERPRARPVPVKSVASGPALAVATRSFADARVRTAAFASLFAVIAYIQPIGYGQAYPRLVDRIAFASSFGNNMAVRLLYGQPRDLLTIGGYSAWRVGGTLAIFAAAWGLLGAVRALRAEEETGRMELVLAGILGRRGAYLSAMVAVGAGAVVLWLAAFGGLVAGGLPVLGSAYLALAVSSVAVVFTGIGALSSQLARTRRGATQIGVALLGVFFVLRFVADTSSSLGALRWATPFGWAEELRPFTGSRPLVLLLPVAASASLLIAALRIEIRRDVGTGLLRTSDTTAPRMALLSSPTAQALRGERGSLTVWVLSLGSFAFITGLLAKSSSSAGMSKGLQQQLQKLGSGSVTTPDGYLGLTFLFFLLAVSLYAVAQISAARDEEAGERLDTLLALPVARRRWLGGRLALATASAAALALVAGALAWAGATAAGVNVSLPRMLEAGANCLPVAILFLGVGALSYALVPRASAGVSYAIVCVAFLWQLCGALLGAPRWLLDVSPFEHVGLVPGQPFDATGAIVMLAIGIAGALVATIGFQRRDLVGA
jgi:ABC-2 type transport system permease protein